MILTPFTLCLVVYLIVINCKYCYYWSLLEFYLRECSKMLLGILFQERYNVFVKKIAQRLLGTAGFLCEQSDYWWWLHALLYFQLRVHRFFVVCATCIWATIRVIWVFLRCKNGNSTGDPYLFLNTLY